MYHRFSFSLSLSLSGRSALAGVRRPKPLRNHRGLFAKWCWKEGARKGHPPVSGGCPCVTPHPTPPRQAAQGGGLSEAKEQNFFKT